MNPSLECRQLMKSYAAHPALNYINLSVAPGRITGLLGPNGSGKTTLIKLASGLLTPTSGQILIEGQTPGVETKKIVSYLPERTYIGTWMKVRDIIAFFQDFYADFNAAKAYDMLPVSYTHLDVYKRQHNSCAGFQTAALLPTAGPPARGTGYGFPPTADIDTPVRHF